jgi:hypothetical protein
MISDMGLEGLESCAAIRAHIPNLLVARLAHHLQPEERLELAPAGFKSLTGTDSTSPAPLVPTTVPLMLPGKGSLAGHLTTGFL